MWLHVTVNEYVRNSFTEKDHPWLYGVWNVSTLYEQFLIICVVVMASPSFITALTTVFDTVCVVFLVLNVNDFAAENSFYDTNITVANMEPFPRR